MIQIFNATGQLVFQKNQHINNQSSINMSELANGLYFLKINNANTGIEILSQQVVKQQ